MPSGNYLVDMMDRYPDDGDSIEEICLDCERPKSECTCDDAHDREVDDE